MLNIFYKKPIQSNRQYIAPNTVNVNNRIRGYLNDVMSYFTGSNIRVRSEHILYKLMITLGVNYRWTNNEIIYYIDTILRDVLKPMHISSEVNIDLIHPLSTIVKNANEIIYNVNELSTLELLAINGDNWFDLQPLKFRNHNFRDLYFNHPTRLSTINTDLIVYTLDIKVLCLMYKYYARRQEQLNLSISIGEFIARYILTNSLITMADISILNNYLDKGNIYINNRQTIGATSVSIYHNLLDDIISKSLISRTTDRLNLVEVLSNIYLLESTGYDMLMLPKNFYETSRSKKYITVVLLDYIDYLTNYLDVDSDGNSQYYTNLKYYLRALSNMNITTEKIIDTKAINIINNLRSKI
jgi:hypothetical protein